MSTEIRNNDNSDVCPHCGALYGPLKIPIGGRFGQTAISIRAKAAIGAFPLKTARAL